MKGTNFYFRLLDILGWDRGDMDGRCEVKVAAFGNSSNAGIIY